MRNLSITTRWMLALVVVAAGCAGCWLWWSGEESFDSAQRLESAEPEKSVAPSVDGGSQELTNLREVLPATEPASEIQSAEPPTGIAWNGTIEFDGERTAVDPAESALPSVGELSLTFRDHNGVTKRVRTPVQARGWRCELPFRPEAIDEVRVRGLVERNGVWWPVAGRESLPLKFDSPASVRLARAEPSRLRVVDAQTGEPLPLVRLDFTQAQPSPATHLSLDWGQSFRSQPIELLPHSPHATDLDTTWLVRVGAPGFVASALAVEFGTGRTYELALRRAGSARIHWAWPEDEAWQAAVRARSARLQLSIDPVDATPTQLDGQRGLEGSWEGETSAGRHVTDRTPDAPIREWMQMVEGLELGEHIATLRFEPTPCESARAIASARFVVTAGERAEVRLEDLPEMPSADPLVQLEFVGYPQALGAAFTSVNVRKRTETGWSASQGLQLSSDRSLTTPCRMEPGHFELSVTGAAAFRRSFEVLGGEHQVVRIELDSLQQVTVILDADASAVGFLPRSLYWCRVSASTDTFSATSQPSRRDLFELLSDSLPIELWLSEERQFRFADGRRLRVEQAGVVHVRLIENPRLTLRFVDDRGQSHAPLHASVFARLCPGGDDVSLPAAKVKDASGTIDELHVWVPEAGTYDLLLPDLEGFESLPRLPVTVAGANHPIFDVPLVRTR